MAVADIFERQAEKVEAWRDVCSKDSYLRGPGTAHRNMLEGIAYVRCVYQH